MSMFVMKQCTFTITCYSYLFRSCFLICISFVVTYIYNLVDNVAQSGVIITYKEAYNGH